MTSEIAYCISFVLGGFVGLAELIVRYKDEPLEAIKTFASVCYIVINALASLGTMYATEVFGWTFGIAAGSDTSKIQFVRILVAGFSSMALLRSSLFTVRVGNQDLGIGFSAVIQTLLRATDAAVDRHRGLSRDRIVKAMESVSFEKAVAVLPTYCLGLMQNLSPLDQEAFARNIESINKLKTDPAVKSRLLGLAVMNVMGSQVLLCAIDSLGDKIRTTPTPR